MARMNKKRGPAGHRKAQLRFAVIGGLLSSPPHPGNLTKELDLLAEKDWLNPTTGESVRIARSTIEGWYYQAKRSPNPIDVLRTKVRVDQGMSKLNPEVIEKWRVFYKGHPHWSVWLLYLNFIAWAKHERIPPLADIPAYSTLRRYSVSQGLLRLKKPKCREDGTPLPSSVIAIARKNGREVRSFENEYVGGLWHLDFHTGSRAVLMADGSWVYPSILAILDDCSRLICHAQWYLNEDTDCLVHGFTQAIQKRGLCRSLMSDNGAAMKSEEFTGGLRRLSIEHEPTMDYSPYQNGKQEKFWAVVEGRLLPMIEEVQPMTLSLLNDLTLIWIEGEYHRSLHSEIKTTPIQKFSSTTSVLRASPEADTIRAAFVRAVNRRQRKTDGTFSLEGVRFEIPSAYRHVSDLLVHYQAWDLTRVWLIDPITDKRLARMLPLDKLKNNSGKRADHVPSSKHTSSPSASPLRPAPRIIGLNSDLLAMLPPQMRQLFIESKRTHLPPSYVLQAQKPQDETSPE
jgi:putative transposase